MKKIENLYIKSFKGLSEIEFKDCGDINILVGDNNACKTSVLEAIYLLNNVSPREIIRTSRKRVLNSKMPSGLTVMDSFISLFSYSQENSNKCINLEYESNSKLNKLILRGKIDDAYYTDESILNLVEDKETFIFNKENSRTNSGNFNENSPIKEFRGELIFNEKSQSIVENDVVNSYGGMNFSGEKIESKIKVEYVSSVDHVNETFASRALSEATKNDEKHGLLKLLRQFDENIEGIDILQNSNSRASLNIKHAKYGYVHISNFGDGLKKVLTLASSVLRSKGGVLLIDEVETAIHTNGMSDVFRWLVDRSGQDNLQIFMTTHSDEALENILKNSMDDDVDVVIYRMEKYKEKILVTRFDEEEAREIILEDGGDLR